MAAASFWRLNQKRLISVKGSAVPLLSVVMPVYNSELYLAEAIESILGQTFTDFEFIIVDDGSEDNSADIIRQYAQRDCRIRLIQLAENAGPSIARNVGLIAAKGELYATMDSDDVSLPERLRKQVNLLQAKPEIGAVGVHCRTVNANMQPKYDRQPPARHALILLNHFVGLQSAPFVHASLMMRRGLVLEAGGYDESINYASDCDLITRMLGLTRFANIPECLYLHRRRPGQRTSHVNPRRKHDDFLVRQRRLERIWGEAPMDALERLARVRAGSKLSWRERRAAKRDIVRIIDSIINAGWVEASERPLLNQALNQRLERVSPRIWQMFCHWRQHNFGA